MPVSYIIHRVRTGLYYDMSQAIKYNRSLDLMTILMVNCLMSYGTSALSIIIYMMIFINKATTANITCTNAVDSSNFTQCTKNNSKLWQILTLNHNVLTCIVVYLLWISMILLLCGDIEENPGPYEYQTDSEESIDSITNSIDFLLENSTSLVHLNVQSINNKLDIIQAEFGGFDIITLNETWLDNSTLSQDIVLQGFQEPFRRDREENRFGGVIVYVKNHIPCKRRQDLEVGQIECIWLECCIYKKKFLIGTFYRPPNLEANKWEYIAYSLEKAKDTNIQNIIITGDFNCNQYNILDSKMGDIISDQGMTQLISECTHFTENSATLLDLLIVNNIDIIEFSGVGENILPSSLRYHCPIFCVLKLPKSHTRTYKRKIWSFSKTDFLEYQNNLKNQNWDVLIHNEIDKACSNITNCIIDTATKTIPNKIVTSRPSDPPWMHNEIRKLIRLRKRHHSTAKRTDSQSNWAQYRKTRNLCINKIRNARQTYYGKVADNLKSGNLSPKQWWKELKRITDSKNSKTYPPIKFDEHSLPISDNKKKADLFNAYFCSQSNVNDRNTNLPNDSNLYYVNALPQIVTSTQNVKDVLETLDTSKATGPDCINPTLLKQAASAIAQPQSKFYNLSLRTSSAPN